MTDEGTGQPIHPTQRIITHQGPAAPSGLPARDDSELIELISSHVERHIGPISFVLHEQHSESVHIDVHCVAPTPERNIWTLVTSGMSQLPMVVPDDFPTPMFLELICFLPPRWPVLAQAVHNESDYWPIRWLRLLARFPHRYRTWLGYGHTIPNGDPPQAFAPNTKFCGMLLAPPLSVPAEFLKIERPDERDICFLAMQPLYHDEMTYKLTHGTDALLDRLDEAQIDDIIDVNRPSAIRRHQAEES
ncbi:MAG: suppressor of fused domain protein [Phycisphaerales bacterium]|nr:suppressor of fused domain protein [Phycisphaerales bacterium]